ncbi:hypothetical protein [Tianweitania sediminis]|uniref:Uncharacterized protein n=1 Tax=Tianweitania sediminis TaxID=1502156 RepID=A0A8J7R2K8_9HYPH|nr:hypothetical protein [Tianweitania sediminis]MBP0440432.1 hypothetical protein [Tianweitania sediminis]
MSGRDKLSLDEFATAPHRARSATGTASVRIGSEASAAVETVAEPDIPAVVDKGQTSSEAKKALRRVKRERMKGSSHFVNVNLDRETKRRLKLASFNADTSMQAIMEKAIRQYLDGNGY